MSPSSLSERLDRARDIVKARLDEPGTLGAFLYGSSVRPYAHPSSDLDVQLIVDDEALASIEPAKRHTTLHHSGEKAADIWIVSTGVLDAMIAMPTGDVHRRRTATGVVVHDPTGVVAQIIARAAEVPEVMRDERMRLHYFEVTRIAERVQVAERRGRQDVVRILTAQLVLTASKLLFLERYEWPAPIMWTSEELLLAGIPAPLVTALEQILEAPTAKALCLLRDHLNEYLLGAGVALVRDPIALSSWLFESPRGKQVMDVWGGESLRR